MKTFSILFIIVALIHSITLLNDEWNGIVLFPSTILFLIAVVYFITERRQIEKQNVIHNNLAFFFKTWGVTTILFDSSLALT